MYQAIAIRRQRNNLAGLQVSLNSLAAIQGTLGNYYEAIVALTEALELVVHNDGTMDEAQARTNLALVYFESGQIAQSLPHFEEALQLYQSTPSDWAECNTLANYANALSALGRSHEAVAAAERSLHLAEKQQSLYQEINARVALGSALPDPREAEAELRLAYQRAQERQLPDPVLVATKALGTFLQKQGRLQEAQASLQDALAQAERLGRLAIQSELHQQLAQIQQALGDLAGALHHFQQFHQRYVQLHQDTAEQRLQSERARQEAERIRFEAKTFRQLAMEDPLTQLYNRRYLSEFLADEIARSRRDELALSVILIDIDDFKQVNDRHSHRVGDQVLLTLATLLRQACRRQDVLVRHSGDEFIIVTPETTLPDAQSMAERLRQTVARHNWDSIAPGLMLTASLGVADLLQDEHLLDRADHQLYRAKQAGKNRIAA